MILLLLIFGLMIYGGEISGLLFAGQKARRAARPQPTEWQLRLRLLGTLAIIAFAIAWIHHLFT